MRELQLVLFFKVLNWDKNIDLNSIDWSVCLNWKGGHVMYLTMDLKIRFVKEVPACLQR